MFGMMLEIVKNQQVTGNLCQTVQSNCERIKELENKVGNSEEISDRLGLLIRNLPMPVSGVTELDQVKDALNQIFSNDIRSEILKAKRVGNTETYVGVVKVEVRNEDIRAAIMKNKKVLNNHPKEEVRNLIISNLRPESQMCLENFARDILKMIPGGQEVYITRSGRLRQRDASNAPTNNIRYQARQPPQNSSFLQQQPPRVPMPARNLPQRTHFVQSSMHGQQIYPHGNQQQHSSMSVPVQHQSQYLRPSNVSQTGFNSVCSNAAPVSQPLISPFGVNQVSVSQPLLSPVAANPSPIMNFSPNMNLQQQNGAYQPVLSGQEMGYAVNVLDSAPNTVPYSVNDQLQGRELYFAADQQDGAQ